MAIGRNEAILLIDQAVRPPKTLYVDQNRTDTYIEDGGFATPFKTIQGSINKIISNGDNSITLPYFIDIIGPGFYNENIIFEDSNLVYVIMDGHNTTHIGTGIGNSLQSTANNNNFKRSYFQNIIWQNSINMSGDINLTTFGEIGHWFENCSHNGPLQFTNVGNIFLDKNFPSTTSFHNVGFASADFVEFFGTVALTTNLADNTPAPSAWSGNSVMISTSTNFGGSPSFNQDTLSLSANYGCQFGSGFESMNIDGTCFLFGGQVLSDLNISATGTVNRNNCLISGVLTNLGTLNTVENVRPSDILGGASGTFVSADAKTITVTNGIITSIV